MSFQAYYSFHRVTTVTLDKAC